MNTIALLYPVKGTIIPQYHLDIYKFASLVLPNNYDAEVPEELRKKDRSVQADPKPLPAHAVLIPTSESLPAPFPCLECVPSVCTILSILQGSAQSPSPPLSPLSNFFRALLQDHRV